MKTKTPMLAQVLVLTWLIPSSPTALAQTTDIGSEIHISVAGAPSMGDKSAKVTMVEFSDYQCPLSSQHFNWTMRQIVDEYIKTGKLKYVFRDFPIESIHPLALKAAEGALCSGEQGKYWEMHDRFFRNQMSIEAKVLPLHALMLGLDVPKFQECLDSGKYPAKIRESVAEGEKAGLQGTPGFFLGLTDQNSPKLRVITYVDGAQPYTVFKEAIDKLLSLPMDEEKERSTE